MDVNLSFADKVDVYHTEGLRGVFSNESDWLIKCSVDPPNGDL
jgi:hypothetical protein